MFGFSLSTIPNLPILSELIPGGLTYGCNYAIEFEPHSLWPETSLAIAAYALKQNIRIDFHTFTRTPVEIRRRLANFGLDVVRAEHESMLRIIDSYTATTGLGIPENPDWIITRTLNLADIAFASLQEIKEGGYDEDRRRLHIDDNTSVFLQYNEEKALIDWWRTRFLPYSKALEAVGLHAFVSGVASDAFYRQFEALAEGIIDFKCIEEGGKLHHYVRARIVRGKTFDSSWRHLRLLENGEVALDAMHKPAGELGIGGWIKGRRK